MTCEPFFEINIANCRLKSALQNWDEWRMLFVFLIVEKAIQVPKNHESRYKPESSNPSWKNLFVAFQFYYIFGNIIDKFSKNIFNLKTSGFYTECL